MTPSPHLPIKIAHVVHSFGLGGMENGLVNLINNMDTERFHHWVCCMTRSGACADRLSVSNVDIVEFDKKPGANWRLPLELRHRFREIAPDVVHSRNWGAIDAVVGARLARVPAVIHAEHGRSQTDPDGKNFKHKLARRILSSWMDGVVCVSQDLAHWLVSEVGVNPDKVRLIHNGVDTERFRPGEEHALRESLGLRPDELLIGTVGRLNLIKDQRTLIEAVAKLIPGGTPVRLILIGDGPLRGELESLSRQRDIADRVSFLGSRDDVPGLLRLLDVFVLPSIGEGISNAILEAMATGLPVIATRIGGNPELVVEGENGFLVPRRDPDALAASLESYRREPALIERHRHSARARAEQEFSLRRMVAHYEALYENLHAIRGSA